MFSEICCAADSISLNKRGCFFIDQAKANDIIKYRETNGPFNSIEELTKVSGIGESIVANIKENITTG